MPRLRSWTNFALAPFIDVFFNVLHILRKIYRLLNFVGKQFFIFNIVAFSLLSAPAADSTEQASSASFSPILDQSEILASYQTIYFGSILRRIWLAGGPRILIRIVDDLGSASPSQYIQENREPNEPLTKEASSKVVLLVESNARQVHIALYPPSDSFKVEDFKKNYLEPSFRKGLIFEGLKKAVFGISELLSPEVNLDNIQAIDEEKFLIPKKPDIPKWLWLILFVPFFVYLRKKQIKSTANSMRDNSCQISMRSW